MSRPGAVMAFHEAGMSGPLRSHLREIRWLAERCDLELALPEGGPASPEFGELGVTVTPGPYLALQVPSSPAGAARLAARTRREVRWFRALLRGRDARLAIAVTTVLPALLIAARLERVPAVLLAAEIWTGRGRIREQAGSRLLANEERVSAAVIACSDAVAREFPDASKVSTIHPGVDSSDGSGDGARFRHRHGIDDGAPLLACVGNLTRGRGQDVLLRALPSLLADRPDLICVINGAPFPRTADLEFDRELDRLTGELGLGPSVRRTSGVEIGDLYAAADVVVNPATTYPEGFGRVAFEAGFAGTPSVCSRVGAIPELHEDGVTTLLVPPGDADALAAAAARLLGDPGLASRIAAGAASLAERIADPERSLAAFQAVVERQLPEPG